MTCGGWQRQWEKAVAFRKFKALWLRRNQREKFYRDFLSVFQLHTHRRLQIGPNFSVMQSHWGAFDALEMFNCLKYDELYLLAKRLLISSARYSRSPQVLFLSHICQTES